MKIWKIWGNNLPELYVNADSFDDALAIARKRHPLYCAGQIQSACVNVRYRVFGRDGHRQRVSFGKSYSFTTFEDVDIKCFCEDKTGSNDYVDVVITAKDYKTAFDQMEKQLSDGIFENSRYGKVLLMDLK